MSYTVGQLAKLTGLTVRALHHYDALGLLVPSQRSDAGYRLYSQPDVVRLYRIQALQSFGLSLQEIQSVLEQGSGVLPDLIAQQVAGELAAAFGAVGVTFNHRLFAMNDYDRSQEDLNAAIAYIRSQAAQLHIDAERIALWVFSGAGPHLGWALREKPQGVRCAVAFYAVLDIRSYLPAEAEAGLVAAAAHHSALVQLKNHGAALPILIARAGRDSSQLNQGLDGFIAASLAADVAIDILNHPQGRHGFDFLDDNARSREIIAHTIAFLRTHLSIA